MQTLFDKNELSSYFAATGIRKLLKGKITDDELNRMTDHLYTGVTESERYNKDCKNVDKYNDERIDAHVKPALIKAGLVCTVLMVIALYQIFRWDMNNKFLAVIECIGFCAAVFMIVYFIQNRNYPKLQKPFCDHDLYDEKEIKKINAVLKKNPEYYAEIKAIRKGNAYYAEIRGEEVDLTKYVSDQSQDVILLEFVIIKQLDYVLAKLDGTPDSVMVETYYCLRNKEEAFHPEQYGTPEQRSELIRIYNKLIGRAIEKNGVFIRKPA